jgi:hypothetical protein
MTRPLILFTLIISTLVGCKKEKETVNSSLITSKLWKKGTTDKNPSTNPNGVILYESVSECQLDDTYKFNTDGTLTIQHGSSKCNANEPGTETLKYSYNSTTHELTINNVKYSVAEESASQLKYFASVPVQSTVSYLVFLLQ